MNPPCTALLLFTTKFTDWVAFVSVIEGAVIVNVVLSSLVIVPVALAPVVMAASCTALVLVTSPRVTLNVSLSSTTVSPLMVTDTLCDSPTVPLKCSVAVFRV